jgi:hypothetical protein
MWMAGLLVAVVTICSTTAYGQSDAVKGLVTRWDDCFLASTQHQFLKDLEAESNLVAELAFQACSTEEQSLTTYFRLNSMPQEQVRAVILRHRNILKQRLVHP